MQRKRSVQAATLSALAGCGALVMVAMAACGVATRLDINGAGVVRVQGQTCSAPGCELNLLLPAAAHAEPNAGHHLEAWGGQCAGGETTCVLKTTDAVSARFEPNALEVSVTGPGAVVAEAAQRSCDAASSPCRWAGLEPQRLIPKPRQGAVFVGFEGACRGQPPCEVGHGQLQAVFTQAPDTLLIDFVGGGGGVVRTADDGVRCTGSCVVPFPPGSRLELLATPDARSFFDGFEAPCLPSACVVRAASTVRVRFEAGRWLGVNLSGTGSGRVEWDGGVLCPGTCGLLTRADAGVALMLRPDDSAYLASVEPSCGAGAASTCLVSPGVAAIDVRFDSVLRWSRAFPVRGSEPYDPARAYFVVQRTLPAVTTATEVWVALEQREYLEIDGVERQPPAGTGQGSGTGLLVSLDLDGGRTRSIVSLENPDGGFGGGYVTSLFEAPGGAVFGFVRCGNPVQDMPCPGGSIALRLLDGGVAGRQALSAGPATFARGAGLDRLGRPLVSLHVQAGGTWPQRGVYRLASDLLQPPVPVFLSPHFNGECGAFEQGTRCAVHLSSAVCALPAVSPGGFAASIADLGTEACVGRSWVEFFPGPSAASERGPFSGRFPPIWFHAEGIDYGQLGSSVAGRLTVHWYAADGATEAIQQGEAVEAAAQPAGDALRLQARLFRAAPLTGYITGGQPFFGRATGEPGFVIGLWNTPRHALDRLWFVAGEVLAGNATVSADERGVMLVLIGRNLRFAGRALAPDSLRTYHHVLFFDDR